MDTAIGLSLQTVSVICLVNVTTTPPKKQFTEGKIYDDLEIEGVVHHGRGGDMVAET